MTEAEIIEKINTKRNELEEKKAANAGADVLKAIEDEIEALAADLQNSSDNKPASDQQVFLDECAG